MSRVASWRLLYACRLACCSGIGTLLFVLGIASPGTAALTNPLAYNSLGSFNVGIGNAVSIDTTLGELRVNGILAFTAAIDHQGGAANAAAGIPELAVFSFDEIDIGPGVAVTVAGNRGLSLLSRGDVTLRSAINVNGGDLGASGSAGGYTGAGSAADGGGPGGGKKSSIGFYAGAGGGSYGGVGGRGGGYTATDSLGGATYPAGDSLTGALYGGSGGGAGQNGDSLGLGGGGGGVLEISALGQVSLFAPVTSNGGLAGVAANNYGGGGGGSGGSVRVAGSKVWLQGSGLVAANGGDGGHATGGGGENSGGGGGGGRVLIQQNAEPLAANILALGGYATGAASLGSDGVVEQLVTSLEVNPVVLNVRLNTKQGIASTSGVASLGRASGSHGDLYGFIDHIGNGFSSAAWSGSNQPFSFTGLVSPVQLLDIAYGTNTRSTETITVKSNGGDAVLAIGRGVGPTFGTNMGVHPDTTINLGSTGISHSAAFQLIVNNASTDLGVDSMLTSLGILGIEVSGPDAAAFSVDNLIPTLLYEGQHANLPIHFHPTEVRDYHATLTIRTDQGTVNGAAGAMFTYQLTGGGVNVVPEPASLTLVGLLATATVIGRRGRARRVDERRAALRI